MVSKEFHPARRRLHHIYCPDSIAAPITGHHGCGPPLPVLPPLQPVVGVVLISRKVRPGIVSTYRVRSNKKVIY